MLNTLKKILILSATPISIFYPLPLIPFIIFSIVPFPSIIGFIKLVLLSFTFFAGLNLWNHVNDIKEDQYSERENIFTKSRRIRTIGIIISISLYLISVLLFSKFTIDSRSYPFFISTVILTWLYSDRMIFGRIITRLKENYLTELVTYSASYPFFILSLWSVVSELNSRSLFIALWFIALGLWNIFLKDIKDMSADEKAGLNTIAIKLGPELCLKYSTYCIIIFYFLVIPYSLSGLLSFKTIICGTLILIPLYLFTYFNQKNWEVNLESAGKIKLLVNSNIVFLFLIGFLELL
jgi:1,4-dihydroxy-2-naphthoate octaprenyltransferase